MSDAQTMPKVEISSKEIFSKGGKINIKEQVPPQDKAKK